MRYFLPLALALAGVATAQQFTLPVNAAANNGGATGWAIFSDFSSLTCDTVITHMTTASTAAAGAAYTVEVFTRSGSGLGGPVGAGAGSSAAGWNSIGVANATQGGTAAGVSLLIDIPDFVVPRGTTVGVAFLFTGAGPRYFGTGAAPLGIFSDGNLTITTGDSRSVPFTTGGSFFSSRGHVGEFRGRRLGEDLAMTDCLPGTFVDISGTGTALNLGDDSSANIVTTVSNCVFAAGSASVGSNGGVRFNGASTGLGFTNGSLPSLNAFNGDQTIFPFWDDVNTSSGVNGNIYWQEIGGTLYVQWNNVAFFNTALTERATFQLQVPSSGPAYAQFIYTDIEGARADGGGSATIGYQGGATPSNDVQYAFNASDALRNGSVISLVEADAVVFTPDIPGTWIDIAGTGTALNLADDDAADITTTVGNALLGAGTVRVGSNGAVRFAGTDLTLGFTNGAIPSFNAFNGNQALMAFWDDINTASGAAGNIYWQEVGNTLVIQWEDAAFFGSPDRTTFQIQVPNSGPVFAQFLYEDVTSPRAARGGSATIGYQAGGIANDAPWSVNTPSVDNGTVLSLVRARQKVGATYCTANPNSTGVPGQIVLSGSASSSANDLRLNAQDLPTNAFGYFIASTAAGFVANAGGSQGNLCLGGNIGRAVGGAVLFSGGSGSFSILANLNAIPQPGGGPVAALPGETWHFQGWHRDSVGGVATSNLTNAAQVQILP